MILEGERQVFSVTLQNLSATVRSISCSSPSKTPHRGPLQAALSNREATPAELYEYELILAKKHALRIRRRKDERRFIAPGRTATFEFEILGKPGLTNGTIQVDYAYLGIPPDEISTKFHTRQVSLQLTVTVNASVEVVRMDVLPLHGNIPQPLWSRHGPRRRTGPPTHGGTNTASCFSISGTPGPAKCSLSWKPKMGPSLRSVSSQEIRVGSSYPLSECILKTHMLRSLRSIPAGSGSSS